MHVLCDTSSVLMLLRLAPDMFTDARYQCVTVREVWEEITQTHRLKLRYPWRDQYRKHIRSIPPGELRTEEYAAVLRGLQSLSRGAYRTDTGRPYDLSPNDMRVAAATVVLGAKITTGDGNLAAFMDQQFEIENVVPLRLVNDWLGAGLFEWDDDRQRVLNDWVRLHEPRQPRDEIRRFEDLAGRTYPE